MTRLRPRSRGAGARRALVIAVLAARNGIKYGAAFVVALLFLATFYTVVIGGLIAFMHYTGFAYVQTGPYDDDHDRLW